MSLTRRNRRTACAERGTTIDGRLPLRLLDSDDSHRLMATVIARLRQSDVLGMRRSRRSLLMQAARRVAQRPAIALRRRYYTDAGMASVIGRLPAPTRSRLGLDDADARVLRRIEIGGGPYPHPGYVHVDADPAATHLEAHAVAWDLPLPDVWAAEILSIHTLEHVHPRLLQPRLREWYRVLAPRGVVRIHVPNSPALMEPYLAAEDNTRRWMLSGALLGMYGSPAITGPDDLPSDADHQILRPHAALLCASRRRIHRCRRPDRHRHRPTYRGLEGGIVDRCSLVVEGRKGQAPDRAADCSLT
jgi:hypothetical protein